VEATSAPRPHALRLRKPRRLLAALSDERLVEHVRAGDAGAFEVLYDRHSAGILGFCRHMLRSAPDAEDAVQQTFIAAHDDIQRHGERDLHVKAWLYTIARNRCLSMLRGRREHPAADRLELVSDNLEHDVQQRDDLRALLGDVAKLPDDQREALVLAEVGALSHTDISEIIGCEVSKVKSLVFQARTTLIDRRAARDTPCQEIREQIATLRGGALRRSHLRHHIEACPGCAQYREDVRRQRAMLAVALPVVPSVALKAKVLGGLGLGGGSTAAAGVGAGGGMAVAAQSGLAKLGIAALIAAGTGGAAVAAHNQVPLLSHANDAAATSSSTGGANHSAGTGHRGAGAAGNTAAAAAAANKTTSHAAKGTHTRSASGTAHGFTPVQGQSNGAAARQFALTRGKGKHLGITKTHHSHSKAHTHTRHTPVAKGHVKHPASTHTTPRATPRTHTAPRSGSTPRQQSTTPTTTEPTPTTTEPTPTSATPTQTQTTPAPSGSQGNGNGSLGKSLGGTKNAAAAG
jgi:RNA polymerase sigma factor (sigma-70 family)